MALGSNELGEQAIGRARPSTAMTAEAFYAIPDDGMRHELVRGEMWTMPPAGEEHGRITMQLSYLCPVADQFD
jgi:hypothetical protein